MEIKLLPRPYVFYRMALDMDHLHFAYIDKPDLTDFETGQDLLTSKVIGHLNKNNRKVLDVGCGLGLTSKQTAQKNYTVDALEPNKEMYTYAKNNNKHGNLNYINANFSSYSQSISHQYGSLIFLESLQYMNDLNEAMTQIKKCLQPSGRIVISDHISRSGRRQTTNFGTLHCPEELQYSMEKAGYSCVTKEDLDVPILNGLKKSVERLQNRSGRIIEYFKMNIGENVENEITILINAFKKNTESMKNGDCGYAIYVFEE